MASEYVNSTVILNETQALLRTKCVSLNAVNRKYDDQFKDSGYCGKPGDTIYVKKPLEVSIRTGKKMDVQDIVQETIPISCTTQIGVDLPALTSQQKLTKNFDTLKADVIDPVTSRLAAEIDRMVLEYAAQNFYNYVGAPGTTPATAKVLLQGNQKLTENNIPEDERYCIINPAANVELVDALKVLALPNEPLSGQYRTGIIKNSLGLNMGISNNVSRLSFGTRSGSIAVDDTTSGNIAQGMTKIHMDAFGAATQTVKLGEKFTIAGVYAVTPETKVNTGSLQQFVVTKDFTASSSEGDIEFLPPIRSDGPRKNVTALPADDALVTFIGTASGTAPANIIMHKDALTLVTLDLPVPKSAEDAGRKVLDGISMRYEEVYDAKNDEWVSRWDIFMGISKLRQNAGVVLFG